MEVKLRTLMRGHCLVPSRVSELEGGAVGPHLLRGGAGCLLLASWEVGANVEGCPVSGVCVCMYTSVPANTPLCLLQLLAKSCHVVCNNLISALFGSRGQTHVHAWGNRDGDKQSLGRLVLRWLEANCKVV